MIGGELTQIYATSIEVDRETTILTESDKQLLNL